VLDEDEAPTRPQHAENLSQRPVELVHRAEDQRAHHGVHGSVGKGEPFRTPADQPDGPGEAFPFGPHVVIHPRVRLHADPSDVPSHIPEVGSSAGSDLHHGAVELPEQPSLAALHQALVTLPRSGHEPGGDPAVEIAART